MKHKLTRQRLRELKAHHGGNPDDVYMLTAGDFGALLEAAEWAVDDWYIGIDDEPPAPAPTEVVFDDRQLELPWDVDPEGGVESV